MKILINLISGQTLPNYFAFLYADPDKIINLYTKDSNKELSNLNKTINIKKKVVIENIIIDPFSYNNIYEVCDKINFNQKNDYIVLNYTAGTKIMSIATYEYFKQLNKELVYFDSQSKRIIISNKNNVNAPIVTLEMDFKSISVNEHLMLNGFRIFSNQKNLQKIKNRENLTEFIHDYLNKNTDKKGIYSLVKARKNLKSAIPKKYDLKKLVGEYKDIEVYFGTGSGGWFEEFAFNEILKLGYFDSLMLNLKVNSENSENEFDIYALKNGNLFLFECKVGSELENSILSKTKENALRYGGKFAKCFLVVLHITPKMKKLAESLNIGIIDTFKNRDFSNSIINFERKAGL